MSRPETPESRSVETPTEEAVERVHRAPLRGRDFAAWAAFVLVPTFWFCVIPLVAVGASPLDATPFLGSYGNDEVGYWIQVDAFRHSGWDAGQFGWEEQVAPAGFTPYGPHGPIYPMLLGLLGRAFGWTYLTPFLCNLAFVTAGAAAFIAAVRPRLRECAWYFATFAAFWPAWMFHVTALQEPLHVGIGVACAGLFIRVLRDRRAWKLLVALICAAALLRATWALLLVPAVLLALPPRHRRWYSAVVALAAAGPFFLALGYLGSPYPYNPMSIAAASGDLGTSAEVYLENVGTNLGTFTTSGELASPVVDLLFRWPVVVAAIGIQVLVVVAVARRLMRRRSGRASDRDDIDHRGGAAVLTIAWWGIVALVVLTFVTYQFIGMRGFRVLAPHVLLVLLVLAGGARGWASRSVVVTAVVIGLVSVPVGMEHYEETMGQRFDPVPSRIADVERAFRSVGALEDPANRWCNTLLWRSVTDGWPEAFVGLPSGIGVTVDRFLTMEGPYRSRWVVLDPKTDPAHLASPGSFRRVGPTPYGSLVENLDSDCPRGTDANR